MLVDGDRMARVITTLVDDPAIRQNLIQSCLRVAEALRDLPPVITATDVAAQLSSIGERSMDWAKRDDLDIRRRLRDLASEIDRMRRLKRGGVDAYSNPVREEIWVLVGQLKCYGLFLVFVGELEEWLSGYEVGVSKSEKRSWSNAAAQLIQKVGKRDGDVWDFMTAIGHYLTSPATQQLNKMLVCSGEDAPGK